MKITFGIKERLIFPAIMPSKGNYENQLLTRDIKKKVEITAEETKDLGLKYTAMDERRGSWGWDEEKEKPLEVEFSGPEWACIKDSVESLNKEGDINPDTIDIIEKIKNHEPEKKKE